MITLTRRQVRCPARCLPPLHSRHRPPRPHPAAGLHPLRTASVLPESGHRTWPSSTSSLLGLALLGFGRPAPGGPGRPRGPRRGDRRPRSSRPDRTIARWSDRGIPQAREYAITAVGPPGRLPRPAPVLVGSPRRAARRPRRGDRHRRRGRLPLRPELPVAASQLGPPRPRRHRRPPGPGSGRLCTSPELATSWSAARPSLPAATCPVINRSPRLADPRPTWSSRSGPWSIWLEVMENLRSPPRR